MSKRKNKSFKSRQIRDYDNGQSAYELGVEAAIDGRSIKECPFVGSALIPWRNGYRDYAE